MFILKGGNTSTLFAQKKLFERRSEVQLAVA